mmetsp:Transcript_13319/g.39687  ORF Transcript_13319/g.39687 Transcript_13319/m.39687 type:complete len:387 (-) Transcript_13319:54-1214(-)
MLGLEHVRVVRHVLRGELDAALRSQPGRGALAQVHGGVAAVRGPDVARPLGVQVAGAVGVLVDPARQGAVLVHVAGALAAAQRDAEEGALADHLPAGDGRHLAVVDDLDRNAAELVLRDVVEDRHDALLVDVRGHVREAVAPRGLAVGGDGAGGAAADSHDGAVQLLGHVLHALHDEVVVVLRVRVGDVPLRLRGVDDLAVLHGDGLHVALAQVEGDAAAGRDLAADDGLLHRRREGRRAGDDLHGPGRAADLGEGGRLELVLAALGEGLLHLLADLLRPGEDELLAAALPEHVPDDLAGHEHRRLEALVVLREHGQAVAAAAASGPLDGEFELARAALDSLHVLHLAEDERAEVRVQRRGHARPREDVLGGGRRHHWVGHLHGRK